MFLNNVEFDKITNQLTHKELKEKLFDEEKSFFNYSETELMHIVHKNKAPIHARYLLSRPVSRQFSTKPTMLESFIIQSHIYNKLYLEKMYIDAQIKKYSLKQFDLENYYLYILSMSNFESKPYKLISDGLLDNLFQILNYFKIPFDYTMEYTRYVYIKLFSYNEDKTDVNDLKIILFLFYLYNLDDLKLDKTYITNALFDVMSKYKFSLDLKEELCY